jgi:esterase/lipase superfamily enzyme
MNRKNLIVTFLLFLFLLFIAFQCKKNQVKQKHLSELQKKLTTRRGIKQKKHTFRIYAPKAKKVYLQGEVSYNEKKMLKMEKNNNGIWQITLYLNPGRWRYYFVVDNQKTIDPKNPNIDETSGFGESILYLGRQPVNMDFNPKIKHGKIETIEFYSKILEQNMKFNIYLPPHYDKIQKYPILFALHGFSGNSDTWIKDLKINHFMDNLITKKKIKPFIVILPDGLKGSWYTDKSAQSIMKEVFPLAIKNYSIKTGKDNTAITGYSMGGYGAFSLAFHQIDTFGMTIPLSMAGGFAEIKYLYPDRKIDFDIELYCGSDDLCLSANRGLSKTLTELKVPHQLHITKFEGHYGKYWLDIEKEVLIKISKFFYQ